MKIQILASQIAAAGISDFAGRAVRHAAQLRDWNAHTKMVEADKNNLRLDPMDRHHPYPKPSENPLVDSAVDEDGVPSFEIIDDVTPNLLMNKKITLVNQSRVREEAILQRISPVFKRRFVEMRALEISAIEPKKRSAEDQKFLSGVEDMRARMYAVQRRAAEIEHEIEDLTLQSIDSWNMPEIES